MSALLVGHVKCWACERQAQVKQIQTRGNRLYLACVKECSTCMRVDGAEAQARLWKETSFISGVVVKRPSNVKEDGAELSGEVMAQDEAEQVEPLGQAGAIEHDGGGDWEPSGESEESEKPVERSGKSGIFAVAVITVAGMAGAMLW